jgi:hypothetical protein
MGLGIIGIRSDIQVVFLNLLSRCWGWRDTKKNGFKNLVNFGVGLRRDIRRVAVVPQVGIRGQRSAYLTLFFEPARAAHHCGVLDGKSVLKITSLREFVRETRLNELGQGTYESDSVAFTA